MEASCLMLSAYTAGYVQAACFVVSLCAIIITAAYLVYGWKP